MGEFWRERAELVTDMWSIPLWNIPQNLGLHDDENIDRYLHAVLPTAWIDEHGEVLGHDECEGTFRRVRRVLEKHRKEDIKHREAGKETMETMALEILSLRTARKQDEA